MKSQPWLLACTLALSVTPATQAQQYSLRFQSSVVASDIHYIYQQEWADRVGQQSGGRITIDLMPVGTIVDYNETLDAVAAGILDGHICDPSYWAGRDPAFGLLSNPVGAWSDVDQLIDFMDNGGGSALMQELLHAYGLHMIGYSTPGLESFVSRIPIDSVADLKGVKLRAPEGMVANVFAAAGAAPINLPVTEVYTSLDKGVVDAADFSVFSSNAILGLNDIARHPVYPGFHSMPLTEVSINRNTWERLPTDLKQLLEATVKEFQRRHISGIEAADIRAVQAARAQGNITIHNWPSEERAKFRRIAMTEWAKAAKTSPMAQKVYDALQAHLIARGLI